MADIGSLIAYETAVAMDVMHPVTHQPTGMKLGVKHLDCKAAQKVSSQRGAIARLTALDAGSKEEQDSYEIQLYSACIDWWEWGEDQNGEPNTLNGEQPDCTPEAVRELFRSQAWIMVQVGNKAQNIANFTGKPATASERPSKPG